MSWACLLCKHNTYRPVFDKVRDSEKHSVVACNVCGHVQLFPVPTPAEILDRCVTGEQRKLVHGGMTRGQKRNHVLADTIRRVNTVLIFNPRYTLDIGYGDGFFIEEMRKEKAHTVGYEAWEEKEDVLKELVLSCNAVTAWHVLEHCYDPIKSFREWMSYVIPDGHLFIEVPNQDNWLLSQSKTYPLWHYQLAHLHYFTLKSLWYIVNQSKIGYKNIKIFGVQRYPWRAALAWKKDKIPRMDCPIGAPRTPILDEKYKDEKEETLTSDTLCMIIQK